MLASPTPANDPFPYRAVVVSGLLSMFVIGVEAAKHHASTNGA